MYQEQEIDPRLLKWFKSLEETPPAEAASFAAQRANFLAEAYKLAPAVSKTTLRRQNGWKLLNQSIFHIHKEHKPMFQILGTLILVVSLFLGAGGITTFAAQTSLPDQPLYSLKLWSEETRMNLADPQQDWQLALEFSERRAAEIRQMVENDQVPPESLQIRLRQQVEQAIHLAVGRQDDAARRALEQIRLRLETQSRLLLELQGNHDPRAEAALIRARQILQERQRWIESGIQEPTWLREQFRLRMQGLEGSPGAQEQWRHGTAQPGDDRLPGSGGCLNCTPQGQQAGGNPWTTGTPTPGSGYGEGQGSNPWTTGTPTPGSGYGPGPGPKADNTCTPEAHNGSGSKSEDQPRTGTGSNPTDQPGSGPGPNPTDQPKGGSGSQPTQEDPGGGDQPGQGGKNPQEITQPGNSGKP